MVFLKGAHQVLDQMPELFPCAIELEIFTESQIPNAEAHRNPAVVTHLSLSHLPHHHHHETLIHSFSPPPPPQTPHLSFTIRRRRRSHHNLNSRRRRFTRGISFRFSSPASSPVARMDSLRRRVEVQSGLGEWIGSGERCVMKNRAFEKLNFG
ncbi:hypothetical protein Droror1_Dr00017241 [Drosera rotundifolia]